MRENIVIQVGQCGNQTGHAFWRRISAEHLLVARQNAYVRAEFIPDEKMPPTDHGYVDQEINNLHNRSMHGSSRFNDIYGNYTSFDQDPYKNNEFSAFSFNPYRPDAISTFFQETQTGCYLPRAVLCDLEPRVIQNLYPYSEKTTFVGNSGAGNNFAAGYYAKESQNIMDIIRMQVESCDNLASLILLHSVSGGTGSGLGSQLLELLREILPKSFINTLSVFPSAVGDIVVQPYNSVLCLQRLATCADLCVVVDNARANTVSQDVRLIDSSFDSVSNRVGWDFSRGYSAKMNTLQKHDTANNHNSGMRSSTGHENDKQNGSNAAENQPADNSASGKSQGSENTGPGRKISHLDPLGEGYAGINGVIAGSLGMTTAVCRFPAPILPSIPALGAILCPIDQLKFVAPSFSTQRTNTMHALGKNILATTQKGLSIACVSVLSRHNEVSQKEMLAQNHKTTTWNPKTNLCVRTSNQGYSAAQLHNYSGIVHLFEKTAEQFDALKRRNAFVEAYRTYSSDLAIFDEARDVCQQIIDAYKSV